MQHCPSAAEWVTALSTLVLAALTGGYMLLARRQLQVAKDGLTKAVEPLVRFESDWYASRLPDGRNRGACLVNEGRGPAPNVYAWCVNDKASGSCREHSPLIPPGHSHWTESWYQQYPAPQEVWVRYHDVYGNAYFSHMVGGALQHWEWGHGEGPPLPPDAEVPVCATQALHTRPATR